MPSTLDALSETVGIALEYTDKAGKIHLTPDETKRYFLKAMGIKVDTAHNQKESLAYFQELAWKRVINPTLVVLTDELPIAFEFSFPIDKDTNIHWTLIQEDGTALLGVVPLSPLNPIESRTIDGKKHHRFKITLNADVPIGYHKLCLSFDKVSVCACLIIAPTQGYTPDKMSSFKGVERIWGVPVQLYALKSKRNWGIGDFTDLSNLLDILKRQGAEIIGLNPLNTLFLDNPNEASPYRPNSRLFLNPLYIDVESIPEFQQSLQAKELVYCDHFQARLNHARATKLVDYQCVTDLKLKVLEKIHASFSEHKNSERFSDFNTFKDHYGSSLDNLATFEALREKIGSGFPAPHQHSWPECYQKNTTPEILAFKVSNALRIDFFKFIHWIADQQLKDVYEKSRKLGFKVGLYQDQAVGVASDSAEVWAHPDSFVKGVDIGAPPDQMRPRGQRWGFATPHPLALNENSYTHYKELMRFNMKYAGALRIDHVMGLYRLFWAPELEASKTIVNGGYVHYSMKTLLAIIAIESIRAKCLIIGEDLGTVPKGFRGKMYKARLFSTKVLHRQRNQKGQFFPSNRYFPFSLAQVSTHDQPSIPAYWTFYDLETFQKCHLFLSQEQYEKACVERTEICKTMIETFKQEGLWDAPVPSRMDVMRDPRLRHQLIKITNQFVARSKSALFLVRLEDLFGQTEMINVPGTTNEYPNWRLKLPLSIEDIENSTEMQEFIAMINSERRS